MKKVLLFFVAIFAAQLIYAQNTNPADTTKNWKFSGIFSLTFNQVNLTNWQAGGENSISGNVFTRLKADYTKNKFSWKNSLELGYGLTKQGDADEEKTDDRIEFNTQLGHTLNKKWEFNGFGNFRTQFTEGFENAGDSLYISNFLAPAYVLAGLGFEYKFDSWFTANLSPVTGKLTIVNDDRLADEGRYGVDPGEKTRTELGGFVKIHIKKELMENISLETKADFFSNYMENAGNIDINWDLILLMKVNKYISANFTLNLIYDDDIDIVLEEENGVATKVGPRTQYKQIFGAGLSYKF